MQKAEDMLQSNGDIEDVRREIEVNRFEIWVKKLYEIHWRSSQVLHF